MENFYNKNYLIIFSIFNIFYLYIYLLIYNFLKIYFLCNEH